MQARTIPWLLGTLAMSTLLALVQPGKTDESPPENPQGVEVLARGPVHEAFAEPVETRPQESPMVPRKPPDPVPELPPDQKPQGNNVQWVAGYWHWDDDSRDFLWVSGIWRDVPPDRQWVPGHWQQVEEGWQWVAGFWAAEAQNQVDYVPPPPPSIDAGPSAPAPDATSSYVPGCWVYREARFWWRPGFWVAFRPDWMWVPAHYCWSPGGCIFLEGYWDHPLHERGLLFAPVRFQRDFVVTVERPYVPSFVVQSDFLLSALFINPHHHYCFGDYFEERYAQRGFVTWLDYRTSRHSYDPTFAYYRHSAPDAEQWHRNLQALYAGRRSGEVPRPPHTLVQQQQVVNNITVNKTNNVTVNKNINITQVQNVNVLAPLNQVQNTRVTNLAGLGAPDGRKIDESKTRVVKLEAVSQEARVQEQKAAAQMHEVAKRRHEAEARLVHDGAPVKPTDPPKPVKLDLPKPVRAPEPAEKAKPPVKPPPPPPPAAPKHEEKPIPQHEPPKPAKPPKPPGKDEKPAVPPETENPEPPKPPPVPPKEPPKESPPPKDPPKPPPDPNKPPPPKEPPPKEPPPKEPPPKEPPKPPPPPPKEPPPKEPPPKEPPPKEPPKPPPPPPKEPPPKEPPKPPPPPKPPDKPNDRPPQGTPAGRTK